MSTLDTEGKIVLSRTFHKNGYRFWHPVIAVMLGSLAILAAWPAWQDLYRIALRDPESSQIILAPFLAIWLFWQRRCRIPRVQHDREWLGPVFLFAGVAAYVLGDAYLIQTAWYLGAIMMVVGAIVSAFGSNVLYRFMPAFIVLLFLIPIPASARVHMAGPLQTATAASVEWVFRFSGMEVVRSGNLLIVNGNPVTVAEACNGMRMTFALILVTYAYVFSTPMRLGVRVGLLIASPLIAIGCNVLRLVPTLWAYGYMESDMATLFHDIGAWLMLGVSLMILMGCASILRWLDVPLHAYSRVARG